MKDNKRVIEGSILLFISIGLIISVLMHIQTGLIIWKALDNIFFGGFLIFDYYVLNRWKLDLCLGMFLEIVGFTQLMILI